MLAQETCIASVKIYMVAELLARSPNILIATTPLPLETMDMPGASPSESFVQPGVAKENFIDVTVGDAVFRVIAVGAASIVGAAALAEAPQAVVEFLTETFGKHQAKEDSIAESSGINEIEDNELDGTPDVTSMTANTTTTTTTRKQLFEDDIAAASVQHKKAKFEAMANSNLDKTLETERREKKANPEELLEAQRQKYQTFIEKLLDEHENKTKKQMQEQEQQRRQENLEAQTRLRQMETELRTLKQQKTDGSTPDHWFGQSPGPDVLQHKVEAPSTQTPMMARMEIPTEDWDKLLEEQVKEWTNPVNKTGRPAPEEYIIEGRLVHNFRELVRQSIGTSIGGGGKFKYPNKTNRHNTCETPQHKIIKPIYSPSQSSKDGDSPGEGDDKDLHNLGYGGSGNNSGGHGSPPDGNEEPVTASANTNNYGRDDKEFQLVNARIITITPFSGRNLPANPHLPFNNALRRLILLQGKDGEQLLDILDEVEQCGGDKFTKQDLQELSIRCPKIYQYDRAIKLALLNYIIGMAHGRVKYGVECGLDAWRKLYHRYVPLAEDLQNILIRELIALKPLAETEVDNLFAEVERITELYMRAGETNPMQDKWVKAAVLQNLPDRIVTQLSLQLKAADIVEAMQSLVNIYLHDHKTGFPKGHTGPMICMAEEEHTPTYVEVATAVNTNTPTTNSPGKDKASDETNVGDVDAVKGGK